MLGVVCKERLWCWELERLYSGHDIAEFYKVSAVYQELEVLVGQPRLGKSATSAIVQRQGRLGDGGGRFWTTRKVLGSVGGGHFVLE